METIGLRELKTNLSSYMKKVKAGSRIIITDRKKEIAVILPLEKIDNLRDVYQMVRNGKASYNGGKPRGVPDRIASRGKSVSEAVIEDRR